MVAALAFSIEEIEADPSLLAHATKECFECDPDNPRAVPRETCTTCGGTQRQPLAAVQIAEELAAARNADDGDSGGRPSSDQGEGGTDDDDSDLYLEY